MKIIDGLELEEHEKSVWSGFVKKALAEGLNEHEAHWMGDRFILECRRTAEKHWPTK